MRRFQFRLQPLLKLREAERQQRRTELADAMRAEQRLQDQITDLRKEIIATKQTAKSRAATGSVEVSQLLDADRYALLLESQIAVLGGQVSQVREEIERRRGVLVEADRQVKVLERLRERQHENHQLGVQRLESKELDEIADRRRRGAQP